MEKEKIDSNFLEIIELLKKNKIKYWICQGTLLGIIRDKCLIPWDHDIDVAVWSGTISKEKIKEIMLSNNYILKKKFSIKDDCLAFIKKGGRDVDINFYEIGVEKNTNKKIAFINWYIPKNYFCKLVEALSMAKTYNGKLKSLVRLFSIFEVFFDKFKLFLIKKNLFYKTVGYTQPLEVLQDFDNIIFQNIEITVPRKSEEYLSYVYGKGWRIPKQNYNWLKLEDSPSTMTKKGKDLFKYH
tara:strand:+ start:11668 stop:12390 length:723 start_codon:yes stop_codon:yes gene_type:complete